MRGEGVADGYDGVYLGNNANKHTSGRLGNDDDGEEKIPVPVKTVDKQNPRTAKRNVEPQPPTRGPGGNRRGGPGGNEGGELIYIPLTPPRGGLALAVLPGPIEPLANMSLSWFQPSVIVVLALNATTAAPQRSSLVPEDPEAVPVPVSVVVSSNVTIKVHVMCARTSFIVGVSTP